ncbi:MAG TPA: ADOP family duplicated permease [Bryobacteraceae bacterium]|nr:ADOP family duplicated permease [Bryobacteraceae bacterium]
MSWIRRFANLFRQDALDREIAEELQSHLAEAIERGRPAAQAERALGSALRYREQSRDLKLLPWLESLAKDVVFGWRQLNKHRAASAAAVLSLGLAIGATTAAFRLVDAVLLRTLPVAHPERLYFLSLSYTDREGRPADLDNFSYPDFRQYRDAVADRADLLVVGPTHTRADAFFASGGESERRYRQYVSGNVFGIFGLRPALGRLLTPNDDTAPGWQPVAVLSYDYWTRRFGRDPHILGQTFRMSEESDGLPPERRGGDRFEIVGVAPKGFTGTDPGLFTDIFIPDMMNARVIDNDGWGWLRIWVRPKPGFSLEQVRQPLQAVYARSIQEWVRNHQYAPPRALAGYLGGKVQLLPAAQGASRIQQEYRRPLLILAGLVVLVLLLACANTGNLLAAQAAARAREMALRVSIGAGRWRLIQLVLVESALLAAIASALGMLFAAWAAPWVVPMLHLSGDPIRLVLATGWREAAFSAALALAVAVLFGLVPALRASSVQPLGALRGGEDPHSRRRLRNVLLAAQMAFCVLVQFVAGLFVTTFERLSNRPLGFSPQHVLVIYAASGAGSQPTRVWTQLAERLGRLPGVTSASLASFPLLSADAWARTVRVPGQGPDPRTAYFLSVAPAFFDTMRIGWIEGRDFRPGDGNALLKDGQPQAGVGIVNQAFARTYFNGRDPVGLSVEVGVGNQIYAPIEIIGYVRDAAYANLREPTRPIVYVPLLSGADQSILVRTAGDPLPLAPLLRREILQARPDFLVHQIQPQSNFIDWGLLHERLLALLSFFFAVVALVLAAIGLYGVLNYAVAQRRREIGIRMALGARSAQVVHRVTADGAVMVSLGAALGVAAGLASGRFLETLLFEVKPTDPTAVLAPLLALMATALLAAVPPAIRAVRIDPARTLRNE